ncbi:MAG: rubrerythrin [Alphaproteobacteria bacterium]|nr:rubrerythrin [Alphaproteobacteria bacterium]
MRAAARKLAAAIRDAEDFRACVFAIESEAAERYAELADLMATHNNREVAALFRRLAEIEGLHARKMLAPDGSAPRLLPAGIDFVGAETVSHEAMHYLMTPRQALALALEGECKAVALFEALAEGAADPAIRRLAAEMAVEERGHVALVQAWMTKFPEPEADWDHDPDPPRLD